MALFHLSIQTPIPHITRGLDGVSGKLRSAREPIEIAIEDVIIPTVKSNINDATAAGIGWQPLNPYTFQFPYRQEFGPGMGPLEVTSALYYAVTAKARWNVIGIGEEARAEATYPHFLPYAAAHEYGFPSPITGGWVPARPYFVINEQDMADIEVIFERWVNDQFGKTIGTGQIIGRDINFER